MRFSSLRYTLAISLILFLSIYSEKEAFGQCADSIDLGTWIEEGDTNNGNWVVTNGGNTVNQTINGDPTFYVSPDSFINVIITGDIQVATTNDDDWIGFVFGYIDPDTVSPSNFDFYLFDWKQQNQNFGGYLGQEGFSLSRVDGPVTNLPQAFSANAGPYVDLIASNYGNTLGWNDLQTYSFALTYTNTRVVISVDGDTIFDVYGCFPPGRFGFYNYSLSNVNYSNFSYRVAAAFEVLTPNVCLGDTAKFIALSDSCENVAGLPVNNTLTGWYWDFGDGNTSTDTNGQHLYSAPGIYQVFLEVTDYLGCTDTAYSTVTVNQLPVILVSPNPAQICVGESEQLTVPNYYTYTWAPVDSLIIDMNNGDTVLAFPDDTTLYFIDAVDSLGCVNDTTFELAVTPLPIVSAISIDSVICPGTKDSLVASGALSYQWSPNYKINNINIQNPIVRPDSTTDYIVVGTGPGGCQSRDTVTVYTYEIAPFSAGSDTAICDGDTAHFSAFGGVSYQWSPSTGLTDPNIPDPFCFSKYSRFYEVSITDSNDCVSEASLFLLVNDLPEAKAGPNDTICLGDITTLGGSPSGPAGALFLWSPSAGLIDTTAAPRPDASPDTSTTYTLLVTDINGCEDMDKIKVLVNPLPVLEVKEVPAYICYDDTGFVRVNGGLEHYNWSPSDGVFNPNKSSSMMSPEESDSFTITGTDTNGCVSRVGFNIEVKPLPEVQVLKVQPICDQDTISLKSIVSEGSYSWSPAEFAMTPDSANTLAFPSSPTNMKLTVTDSLGCEKSARTLAVVYPLPYVDAGEDIQNCNMQVVYLGGEVTAGIDDTITWEPAFKVSNPGAQNPRVISTELDTFYLEVKSPEGCLNYDTVIVNSDCQSLLYAPNAFTPDNDQINDSFRLYGHNVYDYQLEIFDQWGHLIFESNDITFGWDGNFEVKANDSPINTFFWRATYHRENGRQQRQEGHVSLIR
ncbi:MAG: T9SS type B sorting domain-containing protein [Flavobacteriales bacterium]|jgi:gliding motility-associated-like protein|nr:T9SS type B sorting domain-containing protein [Flavobacteriales bacterium]MBT3964343.1 T9SS type B sorting domain-containing protein [Flavobacteriales bacterium]MBT4931674.1 T9SS type B sorting domain-containing protein [Flavobacteriales bacterium]MBT5133640.1 T9SS type B sorting domain-containing protein [Flavobacteriales bacterium]MBT5977791.1 T9SS type B sorting domain-containing protein [Flavobacteriales bacterium]